MVLHTVYYSYVMDNLVYTIIDSDTHHSHDIVTCRLHNLHCNLQPWYQYQFCIGITMYVAIILLLMICSLLLWQIPHMTGIHSWVASLVKEFMFRNRSHIQVSDYGCVDVSEHQNDNNCMNDLQLGPARVESITCTCTSVLGYQIMDYICIIW